MDMDNFDDIMQGLKAIKSICAENSCYDCPFAIDANDGNDCCFRKESPEEWQLNEDKQIRFFK